MTDSFSFYAHFFCVFCLFVCRSSVFEDCTYIGSIEMADGEEVYDYLFKSMSHLHSQSMSPSPLFFFHGVFVMMVGDNSRSCGRQCCGQE